MTIKTGYKITITGFIPADVNDLNSMLNAGKVIGALSVPNRDKFSIPDYDERVKVEGELHSLIEAFEQIEDQTVKTKWLRKKVGDAADVEDMRSLLKLKGE